MSVQQNIELLKRWFREVWNENKIQTVYELFAANGVSRGHLPEADIYGPDEFVLFVKRIRSAFSDINAVVEDAFGRTTKWWSVGPRP